MITDSDLRLNYEFVLAFESLRKRHGYREMSDAALHDIAHSLSTPYETVRLWRHLRNALAHGDRVNGVQLAEQLVAITALVGSDSTPAAPLPTSFGGSAQGSQPEAAGNVGGPMRGPREIRRAFRIHAWTDGRLEQEMIANGFISIGGDEIGDLTNVHDKEVIRDTLTRALPGRSAKAIGLYVGYWARFLWEASQGDLVVLPLRDRSVAIGEFAGRYHHVASSDTRARHRRSVAWSAFPRRDAFDAALTKVLNSQHTVQEFKTSHAVGDLESLMAPT